ncbi:hypothetical protein LINGRAHAP2_LOCUS27803 [Linum grandiflorum]
MSFLPNRRRVVIPNPTTTIPLPQTHQQQIIHNLRPRPRIPRVPPPPHRRGT